MLNSDVGRLKCDAGTDSSVAKIYEVNNANDVDF